MMIPPSRRKGKIAQLPKELRHEINQLLDDGKTYAVIIEQCKAKGVSLNPENLSNWFAGGFQDYLQEQQLNALLILRQENYAEPLSGATALRLTESFLQLSATGMCHRFRQVLQEDFADSDSDAKSAPSYFLRLTGNACRLSREVLRLQQYHAIDDPSWTIDRVWPKAETPQ
jgi:hypothetical protein